MGYPRVTLRVPRGHFEGTLGVIFRVLWDHFGGAFGTALGSVFGHFEGTHGVPWAVLWGQFGDTLWVTLGLL